jgi:hypothetical protein
MLVLRAGNPLVSFWDGAENSPLLAFAAQEIRVFAACRLTIDERAGHVKVTD